MGRPSYRRKVDSAIEAAPRRHTFLAPTLAVVLFTLIVSPSLLAAASPVEGETILLSIPRG
jgi:hypothetical protein